jgi:hypothetical protein
MSPAFSQLSAQAIHTKAQAVHTAGCSEDWLSMKFAVV